MKTNQFIHYRSDLALSRDERRASAVNDAQAITRKALERWENEGGKIPEAQFAKGGDASARTRHL